MRELRNQLIGQSENQSFDSFYKKLLEGTT